MYTTNVLTTSTSTNIVLTNTTCTTFAGSFPGVPEFYYQTGSFFPSHDPEVRAAARELLLSMLDDEQRDEYEGDGRFHVHTADGERCYRITKGQSGNVLLIKDGRAKRRYCIHPPGLRYPDEDAMVAQMMMLETDEAEFLRIANASAP
jgi:hypothetical protein